MKKAALTLVCAAFAVPVFSAAPVQSLSGGSAAAGSLESRVQQLEQQVEVRNRVIADMQIQLTNLQEEVRMLRGQVEEQDFKLSQVLERQRELYRDIDNRLSVMSSSPPTQAAVRNPAVTPSMPPQVETKPPQVSAPSNSKDAAAEAKAYDAIFPLVRNKQYAEAVAAYSAFLKNYPDGKNADNAHYWWGQVHYVQNQLEDAETQFKIVATRYSASPKASDALLKLGEIEKRRGFNDAAAGYYQQVISKFPGTSAAQQAQKQLQDLR